MKNKKKIAIVLSIIAVISLIIILLICIFTNEKSKLSDKDSQASVSNVDEEDIQLAEEYMNTFDDIVILKAVTKNIIYPDGTNDFIFDENIVTFLNIKDKTDITVTKDDYLTVTDGNYSKLNQLDFTEVFGFDYNNYDNLYDTMIALTEAQGINTNLSNAIQDESLYQTANQNVYILNEQSKILNELKKTLDYDEILESYCRYRLNGDGIKSMYIGYINALVKYTKDDKTIFYSVVCEVSIPDSELGCGCGCGSDDLADCEDGETCPIYQSQEGADINYE